MASVRQYTPQRVALRCRVVLLAHQDLAIKPSPRQMNLSRPTILRCAQPLPPTG